MVVRNQLIRPKVPASLIGASLIGAALAAGGIGALLGAESPLNDLKLAIDAVGAKQYAAAAKTLEALKGKLPELDDYVSWYRATALNESKDYASVPGALAGVWLQTPPSPFRARAALLSAQALLKTSQPNEALNILRANYGELTQPLGDLAMADALAAGGDNVGAAVYYQRVYFGYPSTQAATLARQRGDAIQQTLGAGYPPETPQAMLGRATKLMNEGNTKAAFAEFEALIPKVRGAEREFAQVRMGVANYIANQDQAAYRRLSELSPETPEADAERLNYLSQTARRLGKLGEMGRLALEAARKYPRSTQTIDALIAAGNRHLNDNEIAAYEPLYQACFDGLPGDPRTDLCHWKITWAHYLRRDGDAPQMLREHLRLYPASEQSSAALYFLGRLAERGGDTAAARVYMEEAAAEYPNQFYGSHSRDHLAGMNTTATSTAAVSFLRSVSFPQRARTQDFETGAAAARLRRAKLLSEAGLQDLAERELIHGANLGEQSHVLAMELADLTASGQPAQALRYIKRYARGYLFMPIESAPLTFWRLAFPLPYRSELERHAEEFNVDPFLLAALIRQESEFDAKARSVADARGLTQIQPATGRDIARRLSVAYSTAKLYEPSYNLRFGSYYLRWTTDQAGGREEVALAAYNAGLSRAKRWITWGEFQEPAEFIETVPFTQTREYIQAVLRNAAAYRTIYGPVQVASR